MPRYQITADISVMAELSVEASSAEVARGIFDDSIAANVTLVSLSPSDFDVYGDSISEITNISIHEE